ncbi:amino acid adenylation domain-containing protein [Streptomyces hygroscopicus]|uniref:non-ribosomal peptide synthetase n=1 Tax=Streptomyces hygroscopicus TaxID=1912 RepID=UPI0036B2BE48
MNGSDPNRELSAEQRELVRRRLEGRVSPGTRSVPPAGSVPRGDRPALSFSQERLWFLEQLMPGTIAYNAPAAFRISGPLDAGVLKRALAVVVGRHEVLRTRYQVEREEPYQVIDAPGDAPLEITDLTRAADPVAEAVRLARAEGQTSFDLTTGSLFRARLLRLAEDDHVLVLTFHHILFDAWSLGIFKREVSAAYTALSTPGSEPDLPELPLQYADFAAWQRVWLSEDVVERELDHWRRRLDGAPPALELPADRPRPPLPSFRGGIVDFTIPAEVATDLRKVGRTGGATLFMVLLAAYQGLLSRYTGSRDVVVAAPTAGRPRLELENLIGFFVNTLPLRTDLSGDPTFEELVGRVRDGTLEAFAHQDVPFERVVQDLAPPRDLSRNPIVQVWMYLLDGDFVADTEAPLELRGTTTADFGENIVNTRFDLEMHLVAQPDDSVAGKAVYAADLFDSATMERFTEHFVNFLAAVAADPSTPLSRVELLREHERRHLLTEWNDTGEATPPELTVGQWFEHQVRETPQEPALICGEHRLSYAELNARANRLAHHLRDHGVGPEKVVALCLRRGVDLVVAMLAVLKAGAAYLPVDPEYPPQRVAMMFDDATASFVLTEASLRDRLPGCPAVLDVHDPGIADHPARDLPPLADPDDLLYVYFTSGSTGRPKGVAMPNRPILHVLEWHRREFAERPVCLAYFPFTSDASFYEFATTWLAGGTAVLASEEEQLDVAILAGLVERHGITKVIMPNVALAQLLEHVRERPGRLGSLREVVATGDRLRIGPAARAGCAALDEVRLDNHYGPTETHAVTAERLTGDSRTWPVVPSIGRPVAYARVYLLDEAMNLVPPGVPGEIYVGGAALARGYAGRPELTAERFVPDPYATEPGARLYRTGDLARWRLDGTLEFLGRTDHQVKIRGYRIELGEIEATLAAHPEVREAAVVAMESRTGERTLTAYLVPAGEPPGAERLKVHLRAKLPDYMIPAAFVALDAFPLTGTGKIDRRQLPTPECVSGYQPPRTREEQVVAAVWAGVFGLERVGRDDDFFELGGHSLLATRVGGRLREALGVELPLRALFEHRTVAALARLIAETARTTDRPIRPVPRDGRPVLSFAQQRLWFIDQLVPDSVAYNTSGAYRFTGPLDPSTVEAALDAVVSRHEVLRSRYGTADGGPYLIIDKPGGFRVELTDLTSGPDPVERANELSRADGLIPFDLANGPLFRARLLRLGPEDHVLLVAFHHSVFDVSSIRAFHRDFAVAYEALAAGEKPRFPDLPVQYADFAAWQREWLSGERLERQLMYWYNRLHGAPPALELPADRRRPAVPSFRGEVVDFTVPPEVMAGLRKAGRDCGATLFMVMLAAYQAVLARYTGSTDIVVGSPTSGRDRAELEDLVGFFVNTLPLRTDLSGDPSFEELVGRVREGTLEALAHQDAPFEQMVEKLAPPRDLSRNPVVQMWFDLFTVEETSFRLGQARAERFNSGAIITRFDVALQMEVAEGVITGRLTYADDLFVSATMRRFTEHLLNFLRAVADDPATPLSQVPLMSEDEVHRVLVEWNEAASASSITPSQDTVTSWFERQAALSPDAVAVQCGQRRLTFAELNARANQWAWQLRDMGSGPEHMVGVCLRRGVDLVVVLLGVLKSGGVYLPLDPDLPAERMAGMFADAGAEMVVTEESLRDRLPEGPRIVSVDAERAAVADRPVEDPPQRAGPDNLVYVYFTSGSTGRPKGVAMPHRSFTNVCAWQVERSPRPGPTLQFASVGFDISIQEIFGSWLSGGRIVLVTEDDRADPERLAAVMATSGVERWHCPPLVLDQLAQAVASGAEPPPLAEINTAGEQLLLSAEIRALLRRRHRDAGSIVLDNQYGPTEAHCITANLLTGDPGSWPEAPFIGRPLPGNRLYILDPELRPVPQGIAGELCVAGVQLAHGYLSRPDLTALAFVPDPFGNEPGGRLYRTGDLARWRTGGEIEFLGRADHQVKIRGYRIEPGEIETALVAHPGVAEAAVVPIGDGVHRRLAAYVASVEPTAPDAAALRAHLKATLPDYMIPAHFVTVPELPLTSNGKLNRTALPDPSHDQAAEGLIPPADERERLIHRVWAEALGLATIGRDQDFFEIGGHSLLVTRVSARLREELGIEMPVRALYEHRTIEGLARWVADGPTEPNTADHPMLAVTLDQDLRFGGRDGRGVEPARVLLTGATGFLGAHLLAELLDRSGATIACLVRARDTEEARGRIRTQLTDLGRWDPAHDSRILPVPGDLAAPRLGLPEEEYRHLGEVTDVIYHCAAEVSALKPYASLAPVNVGATQELLRLASYGEGTAFHYVSTAGVAPLDETGTRWAERSPEGRTILDSDDVVTESGGYVQTKWVAERLVAAARERGLAASVYRPFRVTGDTRTGRYGADDALVRFIRGCVEAGAFPRGELLDLWTPVDHTARLIVALSARTGAEGRVYNLPAARVSISDIWGRLNEVGVGPLRPLEYQKWHEVISGAGPDNAAFWITATPGRAAAGPADGDRHLIGRGLPPECDGAAAAAERAGLQPPSVSRELIARYVDDLMARGSIPGPKRAPAHEPEG